MKLTFLGTSHGVPSAYRYCQSMLIEAGDSAYLIDAGAPVMDLLLRKKFELKKIRACFTTHLHGDHINGIYSLLDLADWYFKDMNITAYITEQVGIDCIKASIEMLRGGPLLSDRVHFALVKEGVFYSDENIKVTAFKTNHLINQNRPAYGFLIEGDGKRIYISGDLRPTDFDDYPEIVNEEETDLLVIECAHFKASMLIDKLKGCKSKQIVITHVYPDSKFTDLEEIAKENNVDIAFAQDNLTLTV